MSARNLKVEEYRGGNHVYGETIFGNRNADVHNLNENMNIKKRLK